ncbi:MAG: endonuclease/exonuclease/phosphatase family protein [Sporichthyaceae bacterium]|nr:endonuclease/exonuclease/phosphatase family protein [Sporichthyaceae bacterium]
MAFTIATFNANNLFVRYRFGQTFAGDMSRRSAVTNPNDGYLPMYDPDLFDLFNSEQRELAARVLNGDGERDLPDVLCLQEVESLIALRRFNEAHLGASYPYALLIDSRDFRQIDVAVLSRFPIISARSHVDDLDPTPDDPARPWLFSRDCVEVEIALSPAGRSDPGVDRLTVFVNHLKSKFVDPLRHRTAEARTAARQRAAEHRRRQASAVADLLVERYPGASFDTELFAVVGDLNDEPSSASMAPLVTAGLTSVLDRIEPEPDRWTHWWRGENSVSQLDYLLVSPALGEATEGIEPRIERRGISYARILADGGTGPRLTRFRRNDEDLVPIPVDFRFPRFPEVSTSVYASDHCPIFLDVP